MLIEQVSQHGSGDEHIVLTLKEDLATLYFERGDPTRAAAVGAAVMEQRVALVQQEAPVVSAVLVGDRKLLMADSLVQSLVSLSRSTAFVGLFGVLIGLLLTGAGFKLGVRGSADAGYRGGLSALPGFLLAWSSLCATVVGGTLALLTNEVQLIAPNLSPYALGHLPLFYAGLSALLLAGSVSQSVRAWRSGHRRPFLELTVIHILCFMPGLLLAAPFNLWWLSLLSLGGLVGGIVGFNAPPCFGQPIQLKGAALGFEMLFAGSAMLLIAGPGLMFGVGTGAGIVPFISDLETGLTLTNAQAHMGEQLSLYSEFARSGIVWVGLSILVLSAVSWIAVGEPRRWRR